MKRNTQILLSFAALALLVLTACHKKQYLTGYYTYEEFQKQAKWETFVDEKYEPNEKFVDSLATLHLHDSLRVKLFLGTYCHDSKKWVPRFYKVKHLIPVSDVEIISVDTTKKDARGYYKEVKLEKIPTFVFYDPTGKEVGRIVEKPKGGLEKQLYRVLKKAQ